MLLPAVLHILLATSPGSVGNGPGAVANVDDPQSHGAVGDARLSLDEAIRLANGTLALASLSAQEQARVVGAGAVTTVRIDAQTTPTIALQSPLTDVLGQGMAVGPVCIEGVASQGTLPVLDGGALGHILALKRHMVTVSGLRLQGGDVGVVAQMPAMGSMMTTMAMVTDCELDGQATYGVELLATGTDATMLTLCDSQLTNMPVGVRIDDQATNGSVMGQVERVAFDGVGVGCEAYEGGSGPPTMCSLWRSTFVNGASLAKVSRSTTSPKLFMFRIVYTDAVCSDHVVACEGQQAGNTMVHHHHGDWTSGPGKYTLYTHPRTAQFDVHGSEMELHGDVYIAANTASARVWHQNNFYDHCTVTFDCDGALPNLVWNRYDTCDIEVLPLARSPVDLRSCELLDTDCSSAAFLAPLELNGCYRSAGSLNGFATEQTPAPQPFLPTTEVTPREPQVGGTMTLAADVPFGVALAWDVAVAYARPVTSQEPVRFYGDPATAVILPALVLFQSSMQVPIPSTAALVGLEFYAQGIAFPLFGQAYMPPFYLPRGERITLR